MYLNLWIDFCLSSILMLLALFCCVLLSQEPSIRWMSRSSSSRSEIRLCFDASTAFWSTATTERSRRRCTGEHSALWSAEHRHKSNVLTHEHRSCSGRDRLGPFPLSDCSWLTSDPVNPLAVGQYVNNCSNGQSVWFVCAIHSYKGKHKTVKCLVLHRKSCECLLSGIWRPGCVSSWAPSVPA